jgi:hypothetical protein
MENNSDNTESTAESKAAEKICEKINPFLDQLNVEGIEIDKDKIREQYVQLWEYENGDSLVEEELYMTTIALFMYCAHLGLDECNVNVKRSRGFIAEALQAVMNIEIEKEVAEEKKSDDPFKAFVDSQAPKVDDMYSWRHFFLEHKKQTKDGWTFRMEKCWFHSFFIRFGRPDFIETSCEFCKFPLEARKDYVNLKLQNSFAKLGKYCQFTYTPNKSS